MNDEQLQSVLSRILTILSEEYPNIYRADGLNPASNNVAGFIMQDIMTRLERERVQLNG